MQKHPYAKLRNWKRHLLAAFPVLCIAGAVQAQPVISSITPGSGNPGSSVIISGSGFNSTAANNRVYFGATRGTVTSASGSSLNVSIPLGATYSHVSVNDAGTGLTAFSKRPFVPTFDNSGYVVDSTHFQEAVQFVTSNDSISNETISSMAIADIDGDGKSDIIVGYTNVQTLAIFRNTSTAGIINSSSLSRTDIPLAYGCWGVSTADMDGDGKLDILIGGQGVLRNISTPGSITTSSFETLVSVPNTEFDKFIDMDGDGKADIVSPGGYGGLYVSINTSTPGSVSFNDPWVFMPSDGVPAEYDMADVGDIDGDGKPDVVLTAWQQSKTIVYRNNFSPGVITDASMDASVSLPCNSEPSGVCIGDMDGDGKQDIVLNYLNWSSVVSVFKNTATAGSITSASFAPKVDFSLNGEGPWGMASWYNLAIGDMNGDGKLDIIAPNTNWDTEDQEVTVLRNVSTSGTIDASSFVLSESVVTPPYPLSTAIGDIDNDGISDIVVFSSPSDGTDHHLLSVIRNTPVPAGAGITGTFVITGTGTTTLTGAVPGGTWSTACNEIATVSSSGVVTGVSRGLTTITYTTGSGYSTAAVTVNGYTSTITGPTLVCVGSSITLSHPVAGGTWSSSAVTKATVSATGVVTGIATGTPRITYTYGSGCASIVDIDVEVAPDAPATAGAWSTYPGGTTQLSPTGGVWSSSNPATAAISSSGLVTGLSAGTVILSLSITNSCATTIVTTNFTVVNNVNSCYSWANVGSAGFTAGQAANEAIAIDAAGNVYAGYRDNAYGNKVSVQKFNGTSWSYVGAPGFSDITSGQSTLALDNSGSPWVAYAGGTSENLSVKKYDGSSWVAIGLGSFSGIYPYYPQLAFDNSNVPYVAYVDATNGDKANLKKFNGSGWVFVGSANFTPAGALDLKMVMDASGTPFVVYRDVANGYRLSVMKYNGSTWANVGAPGFSDSFALNPSIAVDNSGTPYVSYADDAHGRSLTVKKFNGSSWVTLGTERLSYYDIDYNQIIVDGSGMPYVVYNDFATGPKLSAQRFNGGAWEYVGTPGFSAGPGWLVDPNVTHISATVDASGVVYVGYSDAAASSKLTVMRMVPATATITGSASLCVGNSVTLSSTSIGGTWNSTDPSVATVNTITGLVSGLSAGTTVISYSLGTCGASKIVTVNPATSAGTITGTATVCTGNTTTLGNATTGGTWSSSNTSVATVGSATGIVSGAASGNATITYTVTSGCGTATATAAVTVNSAPSVATITGTATVCTGNTTTLNNATSGGAWSSSNTSIATVGSSSGIVSGLVTGNATITYTVTNGCGSATATKVVTVNATASAGTITGASSICTGATATLSNAVTGGTWSSSDDAIATVGSSTGIVTGISSGNATITYTVSGSCGTASATTVVTVGTSATITGSLSLCSGMTSSLSGGTTGGVWSSGNTAVATIGAANGILTAVSTGTANITYDLGSGCTATAVVTVSMPAIIAGTSNTCVGQTATLTDATSGGVWSSSNTSLATVDVTTGVVTGIAAGSPTISYYVSTGCYRTITFTVKALPPAIAGPVAACEGSTVYVTPPSTNGQSWTSSNTSVAVIGSSTGMLTGVMAGTTTLTYTTVTGCFVTTTATVNAGPGVIAGTLALCSGSSSSLSNPTTGGTWSSSNSSVASIGPATGVVTAGTTGTATITYNTSGCRATAIVTVSPIAAITGTPSMCVGSSVTLSDATSGGTWSSSNTGIAIVGTSGIVTGVATGNATITYTIASGCTRTVTATVVATPGVITGSLSICPSTTATLSGGTPGGSWSGGNASIATINSSTGVLSGIGAGTINVSYTLTGCRVTAIATVNPQPAVITGTTNACVAQTSTLNDATSGGAWSSNNTGIATVDPSTGMVTGVSAATTTMTYTLGTGCYRTIPFTVKALPPAIVTTAAACVGTSTYIAPPSTNGKSWSSSNTTVATIGSSSGMLAGVSAGTTILTYTTTTGCYVTTEATVYALPSAGTITGPSSVVVGNTITLDDIAIGGVWSSSNTAKATIGAGTGIVTGVAGGAATISFSVSNPGCTVRATKAISVLTSRPGDNGQSTVSSFQLYPNPTTGAFTVEAAEAGIFNIYSLDGKEVSRHNITAGANQFSLPGDLASGIYMCRFTGESGNTTMVRVVFER